MLPRVGSALTGARGTTDPAAPDAAPMKFASLRKLQLRKQAIAAEVKAKGGIVPTGAALNAQLIAQQMEIKNLKKERDNMSDQLQHLQDLPKQIEDLKSQLKEKKPSPDAATPANPKFDEMEHQLQELMDWRNQQWTKTQIEAAIQQAVATQDISNGEKNETLLNTVRVERQRTEERLFKRIDADHKRIAERLDKFKDDVKKHETQILALADKIEKVGHNESKTWETVSGLDDEIRIYIGSFKKAFELSGNTTLVDRLHKFGTLVGQVKTFQSEQAKLSNEQRRLTMDQDNVLKEQEKLVSRIAVLEKSTVTHGPGPGFKKVGTPVTDLTTPNSSNASVEIALQRFNQVEEDIKSLQQSSSKFEELSSQVERIDGQAEMITEQAEKLKVIENQSSQLSDRMAKTEERVSDLGRVKDMQKLPTSFAQLEARLADVEARGHGPPVQLAPDASPDPPELSLQSLDEALQATEATVHIHDTRIDIVEKAVPELFKEYFDPLKKSMTEELNSVKQSVTRSDNTVAELKQQLEQSAAKHDNTAAELKQQLEQSVAEHDNTAAEIIQQLEQSVFRIDTTVAELKQQPQRTQSPAQRNPTAQDPKLRQDLFQLQTTLQHAVKDIGTLQQDVLQKADKVATDQRMDSVSHSFRNLQDQYNNITTDDLHARMVQWFLQNYPSNTANMLQQYASLHEEVNALKELSASVAWIQSRSEDISSLVKVAPQVHELLSAATELRLPELLAKIDEAYNNSQQSVTVAKGAQNKAESHTGLIKSLQQSLHNLNSTPSLGSTTQAEAIQAFEQQLRDLQKDFETGLNGARQERINAINEVKTAAGTDHELRVKEMKGLKASVASCRTLIDGVSPRVTSLEEVSTILRADVDTINNDYITPNRKTFALFSHVLITACQLQELFESVNQNLPHGPIEFQWHIDLNNMGPDGVPNNGGKDTGEQ
jgi:chromosome segregation ATPase